MCGITGIMHFDSSRCVEKSRLKDMTNILKHRGPDGNGLFIDDNVALGHRRLSIIDLSSGNQPMSILDGRYTIVYNGELYNYKELREELVKRGHKFRTKGDTETILHLYEEYGEKCLDKMDGMYAFAVWDRKARELFNAWQLKRA